MSKSIFEKLGDIDTRILYALMFIVVALPLLFPIGLPIEIKKYTRDLYNAVETLPAGSVVILTPEFGPSGEPHYGTAFRAVTGHVLRRPLKLIFITHTVQGPMVIDDTLKRVSIPPDKKYGVDYVNFGYIAGGETAMAAVATDIHKAIPRDIYETPVENIPMMSDIHDGNDMSLVVTFTGDGVNVEGHIRQFQARYGVLVGCCCESIGFSHRISYYPTALVGVINDMVGGAEYQQLVYGRILESSALDAQSMGHLLIIVFLLIGNVSFISRRFRKM